ncbi:S8 family serine peptidase [Kribbella sp. NPDC056861]|uniref:S8 family peptidase n=1 Tax=Kribbella sp. NPDC056861 TaxID=3154857 RepID=UPI003418C5DF
MRSRGRPAIAAGVLLGLVLTSLQGAPAVQAAEANSPAAEPVRPGKPAGKAAEALPPGRVTLLTGDRVTIDQQGQVQAQAGPGRKVRFEVQQGRGRLYVVPSDVSSAVTAGKLDRALFEVAGLIRQGLDDQRAKELPLLVTYDGKPQSFAKTKGSRQLPSIDGVALKVAKRDAASFLTQLTGARAAAGVKKVWLDTKFKPTLDKSVPQVGAPAAWQAGFTGTGVSVAVIDTGIDATHADLKAQLAGQRNFTDEADGDKVGHGTHVASIIAGTGAAAGGKFKGVAPGARLYDGKVCSIDGCTLSAIVAGMEWAATEVRAKVVNLSLGGYDDPETDPVEEALARLTEQTGTLFVVAAGNSGEGAGTIESPGSAAAALTVGAVDKQDKLAWFSSRGPLPDGTVKPDLTAPGVAIVAARAAGTEAGTPVDEHYTSLNGTSMATPHVAGAAAILAQQHPDWKAGRLKTQLMSAAKPIEGQSGDEQGTGRLDVANAVASTVVAEPGSLWFGKALYPHDDDQPITKTLTYRNTGDQPVALAISAALLGPDSKPAPAGAIKLGAQTLTVPAGGTASVPVIVDTKHSGPDGRYSGQVVAKAGERTVTASIAVEKEVPSFDLTIKTLGPDGKPAEATTALLPKTEWAVVVSDPSGTVKLRLPRSEYALRSTVETPGPNRYDLVLPILDLAADTTVVMDARQAKPLRISTKQPGATLVEGAVRLMLPEEWGWATSLYFVDQAGLFTAQVGPPAKDVLGSVATRWARRNADGTFDNSPYQLNQLDKLPGRFPTGSRRVIDPAKMVRVDETINATSGRRAEVSSGDGYAYAAVIDYDLPARRRSFHDPASLDDPSTAVFTVVSEFEPGPERVYLTDVQHKASYLGGRNYRARYNAGVFAPGPSLAVRGGGLMAVVLTPLADADGQWGGSSYGSTADLRETKLYRDGELVVGYKDRFGWANPFDLPPEPATYKLVSTIDRHSVSRFSTRVEHVWTFRSGETGNAEDLLPLLSVRYRPVVDDHNLTARKPITRMPVVLTPQPGAPLPRIKQFTLQYQGAAGSPWRAAKLVRKATGQYVAEFPTPVGDSVSLRATVVDGDGNSTAQTVTDAIRWSK